MYGSTTALAGALRGSKPYASAWLSSSAISRGSASSRRATSARVAVVGPLPRPNSPRLRTAGYGSRPSTRQSCHSGSSRSGRRVASQASRARPTSVAPALPGARAQRLVQGRQHPGPRGVRQRDGRAVGEDMPARGVDLGQLDAALQRLPAGLEEQIAVDGRQMQQAGARIEGEAVPLLPAAPRRHASRRARTPPPGGPRRPAGQRPPSRPSRRRSPQSVPCLRLYPDPLTTPARPGAGTGSTGAATRRSTPSGHRWQHLPRRGRPLLRAPLPCGAGRTGGSATTGRPPPRSPRPAAPPR